MFKGRDRERGAAVVEFALVVPLLLLMIVGIAEFGRAYQVQTTISGAAREGVRSMALHNNVTTAKTTTKAYAPGLGLTDGQITVSPGTCTVAAGVPAPTMTVTVTRQVTFLTSLLPTASVTLTGKGVMRCGG